jgi:ribosomal protein L40E
MELLILPLWIIIAIVVGAVARSRGRSGVGFFLFAVFSSPFVPLIVLLLIRNYAEEERNWERERQIKPAPSIPLPSAAFNSDETGLMQLERLAMLWKSGALSDEEFRTQKAAVLVATAQSTTQGPSLSQSSLIRDKTTQIYGICPSCRSTIEIEAQSCRNCGASSAANVTWHPQAIQ